MVKVTIIGAGSVGSTIAYTLAVDGIASEIVMVDINEEKALGEALDIRQGTAFCPLTSIYAGSYRDAVDSDIVILTSGVARKPRKVEEEAPAFLEPIKFRYSEEAVVEEPAPAVVEEEEVSATEEPAAKPGRSRNRNRRNRHKGEKKAENTEAKKPEKPVEEKKAEKPAAENSGEEKAKKPHHHRRRYHHRGKGQGKGQNQE